MNFYKYINTVPFQGIYIPVPIIIPAGRGSFDYNYMYTHTRVLSFFIPSDSNLLNVSDWITEKTGFFMGVDRSLDPVRLSGFVYRNRLKDISSLINKFLNISMREGAPTDLLLVHPECEIDMVELLSSPYMNHIIQFEPSIPKDKIYAITAETWTKHVDKDGNVVQLTCNNPGWNGVLLL